MFNLDVGDAGRGLVNIRRLGWAGLELEADGALAVIDLFEDATPLAPWIGEPHEPLPPPSRPGEAALALVTHLHADHADPAALARALAPDGVVLRPAPATGDGLETIALAGAEAGFAEHDLATRTVAPWERVEVGPFAVTALPAVDGFGDPQVSWIVEADGTRILHAGDTLFHGWWWLARMRCGPIDLAFLPVNGAVCDFPHRRPPSAQAACMGPRDAAQAAAILEAGLAVPIHYGALHRPPTYAEVEDPAGAFAAAAADAGVDVRIVAPGEPVPAAGAAARS